MSTPISRLTLCFGDEALEAAFKADAFRNVYLIHVLHFGLLIMVLVVGLTDPPFRSISACLLPIGCLELLVRRWLHGLADHGRAQRIGALTMLTLTTVAWGVYVVVANRRAHQQPISVLVTVFVALMMFVYPVQLCLFMLSPRQRAFAMGVALLAITIAPTISSLPKHEEWYLHFFALSAGLLFESALELMLREAVLLKVKNALITEKAVSERLVYMKEEQDRKNTQLARLLHELAESREEAERLEEHWASHQRRAQELHLKAIAEAEKEQRHLHESIEALECDLQRLCESPSRQQLVHTMSLAQEERTCVMWQSSSRHGAQTDHHPGAPLIHAVPRIPVFMSVKPVHRRRQQLQPGDRWPGVIDMTPRFDTARESWGATGARHSISRSSVPLGYSSDERAGSETSS